MAFKSLVDHLVKSAIAIIPSAGMILANQFFDLFRRLTIFGNPDWQNMADSSASAVAIPVAIILGLIWHRDAAETLKSRAWIGTRSFVVLAIVCSLSWFFIDYARNAFIAESWQNLWFLAYMLMLVSVAISIVAAILYAEAKD